MIVRPSLLLLLVPAWLAPACVPPEVDYDEFTVECDDEGKCPSDLTCGPDWQCRRGPIGCDLVCARADEECGDEPAADNCGELCGEHEGEPGVADCFFRLLDMGVCHPPDLERCVGAPATECIGPEHCDGHACDRGACTDEPEPPSKCREACDGARKACPDKLDECLDVCEGFEGNDEAVSCLRDQTSLGVCIAVAWRRCGQP